MSLEDAKKRRVERLSICKECPFFLKNTSQCDKCGCIMTIKTLYQNTKCPIDRW